MSRFFWFANVLFRLSCNSPMTCSKCVLSQSAHAKSTPTQRPQFIFNLIQRRESVKIFRVYFYPCRTRRLCIILREYTRLNDALPDDVAQDHHQNDEPFLREAALLREKQHLRTR